MIPPSCPHCGADPFETFMLGQVCRSNYLWHRCVAWISGLSKPGYWAVICRRCKNIVGYTGTVGDRTGLLDAEWKSAFAALKSVEPEVGETSQQRQGD